jgi:hypothetical protein
MTPPPMAAQVSRMLSGWWLSVWSEEMGRPDGLHGAFYYLWIYTAVCRCALLHAYADHNCSRTSMVRAVLNLVWSDSRSRKSFLLSDHTAVIMISTHSRKDSTSRLGW